MKKHLIGSQIRSLCGRELDSVEYTIDKTKADCKSCLKNAHEDYPKKGSKNDIF